VSVSTQDGLRSVGDHGRPVLPAAETARRRHHLTPVAGPATLTTAAPEREELRDGYPEELRDRRQPGHPVAAAVNYPDPCDPLSPRHRSAGLRWIRTSKRY
jgi:hypothetical protein